MRLQKNIISLDPMFSRIEKKALIKLLKCYINKEKDD